MLVVGREMSYLEGASQFGSEVLENSIAHLSRSQLFSGVSGALVEQYAPIFGLHVVPGGTGVVLGFECNRHVHVIRRGKVRLEWRPLRAQALVVAELGPGDVFGVSALTQQPPLEAVAFCVRETMLLSAPANDLISAMSVSAQFSANVAEILAGELAGIATAVAGLQFFGCARRIHRTLERIAREHGVSVADGVLLDVELHADDLAVLTRMSPEDAQAALFSLQRGGYIQLNGALITLLRRAR